MLSSLPWPMAYCVHHKLPLFISCFKLELFCYSQHQAKELLRTHKGLGFDNDLVFIGCEDARPSSHA